MKRKVFIALSILIVSQSLLVAQGNETTLSANKIGVTFSSFGGNDIFRFKELDGAASYGRDYFYTVGINYLRPINKWLEVETGIEYSKHHIIIRPMGIPGIDNTMQKADFSQINIPVTLRANFLKYFFINGGLIIDFDASTDSPIDSQTGIGALAGIAVKYDCKNGMSAFVNPYTKLHSLVPLSNSQTQQRILETGIRIGVTYTLKTK